MRTVILYFAAHHFIIEASVEYLVQFTQSLTDTFLTGSVILVVNIYSQTIPGILFKSGTDELGSCKVGKDCVVIVDDKYMNDGLVKLPKTLRGMPLTCLIRITYIV